MAKPYFRQVPDFEYISRNPNETYINEYVPVKNLFKRGKLRDDIFGNLTFFEKYKIIGDEKPYNIAYDFYDDETLDWVVLLSNNILDINTEWPLAQNSLDRVLLEKYGSYENLYSGIHHYETQEITNTAGVRVLKGGTQISPTWRTNGNFIETINSQIANISSGDSVTPSTTVTVFMLNNISNLDVGDQITINNVVENAYNGKFIITEVLAPNAFRFELPEVPSVAQPVLANPRQEVVTFTLQEDSDISANAYYYEYYDDNLGYTVQVPSTSFVREVTNYEYEIQKEEEKRNIYVLKPTYLGIVFNDMDKIMNYKEGAEQFVNRTLKRADDIRLFT